MKRISSVFLTILILFSIILNQPHGLIASASSDVILQFDSNIINQVGQQASGSISCSCFALAYCRSILDGYAHSWNEYNQNGNSQFDIHCRWDWGGYRKEYASSPQGAYQAVYDQVNQGKPSILHVNGRSSEHWITIIGYRGSADRNNLKPEDFYILDPSYTLFGNMGETGHQAMETNSAGYAYVVSNFGSVSIEEQPNTDVEKPVVSVSATDANHPVTVSYNACENATHYDIRFYNSNDTLVWAIGYCDDAAAFNNLDLYANTSYSHTFPVGSYYVKVAAVNASTAKYKYSDTVSFTVSEVPKPTANVSFEIGEEKGGTVHVTVKVDQLDAKAQLGGMRVFYPSQFLEASKASGAIKSSISPETNIVAFAFSTTDTPSSITLQFDLSVLPTALGKSYTLTAELVDYRLRSNGQLLDYSAQEGVVTYSSTPSGKAGNENDIDWTISETGTLSLFGSGYFDFNQISRYVSLVRSVQISAGIKRVTGIELCPNISSITLDDNNLSYDLIDGVLLTKDLTQIVWYPNKDSADYTIPDSVTSIGKNAFSGCTNLTSITIPDSVKSIGENAFSGCQKLWNIEFPDRLLSDVYSTSSGTAWIMGHPLLIVDNTLKKCDKRIEVLEIENGITQIGESAFSGCTNLTSITIPESVTNIGAVAFYDCKNLSNIKIPDSVTSIGSNAFKGTKWLSDRQTENPCVIVNHILIDGKTALGDVIVPDGITSISANAFSGCTNLTSITIPDSVTSIGYDAFSGCTNLTNITIPESVTNIGYGAFEGTKWLSDRQTENPCVIVNHILVDGKTAMREVIVPDGVTSIGDQAFFSWKGLTSITLPDSVTSIGYDAFGSCINLTTVNISDGVTDIGNFAFHNCQKMTSIVIPDNVTSIGKNAFSGCTNLTIKGYLGSVAEQYAKSNNISFEALVPVVTTTTTASTTTTPKPTTTTTTSSTKSTTTQSTTETTNTTKTELIIDKTSVTMTNGDQYTIIANRNDVTYKSNNPDVAIVSSNGVITAVGVGQATISAFDSDSNVVQIKVEVTAVTVTTTTQTTTTSTSTTPKPTTTTTTSTTISTTTQSTTETTNTTKTELIIDKTSVTMTNGDQYTIIANRNDVTYKSNNPDVAIVSSNGVITAVGVGQATISAFDSDSNVVQIKVEVTAITITTTTTTITTTTVYESSRTTNESTTASTTTDTTTTPGDQTETITAKGDINGDGEIGIEDAQLTLNAYVAIMAEMDSGLTAEQFKAADVNGDNAISVEDAQFILIFYVQNTVADMPTTWDELLK